MSLTSLPNHLKLAIFDLLVNPDDLQHLRLVCKDVAAAATQAIRKLRPTRCPSFLSELFPTLRSLDCTRVPEGMWSEAAAIGAFSQSLTSLKLGPSNRLTTRGAGAIAELRSLESLELLEGAAICDHGVQQWSALTQLTLLSVRACGQVTDEGLTVMLRPLTKLREIDLGACHKLGDGTLSVLGTLPELRKCDLASCCGFTSAGIEALAEALLRTLLLPACWQVDDGMLATIVEKFPRLETFSLFEAGESVSDLGMLRLRGLSRLTALDLGYSCWVHTPAGLEELVGALPAASLRMLSLGGAEGVRDSAIAAVARTLTLLTFLDISECQRASADGVKHLKMLTHLVELNVGWNLRLPDAALQALPPSLVKLEISYCSELSLEGLTADALPHLLVLHARRCSQLSDAGLAALVAAAPCLRHLDISSCSTVTPEGLRSLSCSALRALTIVGCPRAATQHGMACLAAAPALEAIDASNNARFDDGCVAALSRAKTLRRLSLGGCPRVSDRGVAQLASVLTLESLVVDCRNVNAEALLQLQTKLPRLTKLRRVAAAGERTSRPGFLTHGFLY